jgi:hypothetical protein
MQWLAKTKPALSQEMTNIITQVSKKSNEQEIDNMDVDKHGKNHKPSKCLKDTPKMGTLRRI